MEKQCSQCKRYLSLEEFGEDKQRHDGRACRCFKCNRERRREHKVKVPDCKYYADIKWKYNLTKEQHSKMLKDQNECCLLCGETLKEGNRYRHIDHCHITGKVRGILCGSCNVGLGNFRDRPDLLRLAAIYLEKP